MDGDRWLSQADLAEMFGVSIDTIRRLRQRPGFPAPLRLGQQLRWRTGDIDEWTRQSVPRTQPQRGRRATAEELMS